MKLTVNGETMDLEGVGTVADLLKALRLEGEGGGRRVAVAVNLQVVPRAEHARTPLAPEDRVEIIQAVGGGRGSRETDGPPSGRSITREGT